MDSGSAVHAGQQVGERRSACGAASRTAPSRDRCGVVASAELQHLVLIANAFSPEMDAPNPQVFEAGRRHALSVTTPY